MVDASGIIKEYAFQLGWQIDQQSMKAYQKVLQDTEHEILAVGASLAAAGLAAVVFVDKMSSSLEKLYFATRRTGTTAEEFQQFGLAIQNAGGSADGAAASLQNLAAFLRNNPGGSEWLTAHGVDPKHIGDAKKELDDLATRWKTMPWYQARAEAQVVGIDDQTLLARLDPNYHEDNTYANAYKAFGMNADEATAGAHKFQEQLRGMEANFVVFGQWLENDMIGPMSRFNDAALKGLEGLQRFITLAQTKGLAAAADDAVGGHHSIGEVAQMYYDRLKERLHADENLDDIRTKSYLAGPRVDPLAGANQQLKDTIGTAFGRHTAFAGTGDPNANNKAQYVYDQLRNAGIPDTQAKGMVGAFWEETGGTFDPKITNPDSGAVGLEQLLSKDRMQAFRDYEHADPRSSSLEQQIDFAAHEVLAGNEKGNAGGFMAAGDPGTAGKLYEHDIERPASSIADGRAAGYADHVAVTVHIHGNATEGDVRKGVAGGMSDAAAQMTRNFQQ